MDTKPQGPTGNPRARRRAGLALALLAVFFMTIGSLAALSDAFVLDWWTVGSGGTMTGGAFSLSGSAGQADAGTLSGGTLRLSGGYWNPPVTAGTPRPSSYRVVLPAVLRQP